MSTKRFSKTIPASELPKGPNGRNLCRWCKEEVPKGRRTFCGKPECTHEFNIRRSGAYARRCVWKRDKGVCAICKKDTEQLQRIIDKLRNRVHSYYWRKSPMADAWRARAITRGEKLHKAFPALVSPARWAGSGAYYCDSGWQADHIVPVAEGGGECGLDGYRTLCTGCHLEETRKLHKRLKEKRKQQLALPLE